MIAARIAQLPPYEHAGQQVTFVQVATDSASSHAELVSWPPLPHERVSKGVTRTWWYSGLIRWRSGPLEVSIQGWGVTCGVA